MRKTIFPYKYQGEVIAPASKSYLQRAIAIALLCPARSYINHYYPSSDAKAAINIARALGAEISIEKDRLIIKGTTLQQFDPVEIHCGESGLSTRMFSPIAGLFPRLTTLTGEGSLNNRPVHMIVEALKQLQVEIRSSNNRLPLKIKGPLIANEITIDGSESSQLLTGLLIALPLLDQDSIIHVQDLKSIPYIQMTLDILDDFGIKITHDDYHSFTIKGNQVPQPIHYTVEGDWSGAAFHLVGAAISGKISIKGLNPNSAQADRKIITALRQCGAQVEVTDTVITVSKKELNGFQFDATHCPDLFPPLAVLGACCNTPSTIRGISRLLHKESNRAKTILKEFSKLSIKMELESDNMIIHPSTIIGSKVTSHNDHRIAMALATLAAVSDQAIEINQSEAVNKSYPTYFNDLEEISRPRN